MAIYNIFGSSAPEDMSLDSGTDPVNIGTAFYVLTVTGWRARGVRIYIPSGAVGGAGAKAYLWSGQDASTATQLATANFGTLTAGWNEIEFATTYPLTPSQYYWVSVYLPNGGFGAKSNVFTGSVQAPGGITLYGAAISEVAPGNGAFAYGAAGLNLSSPAGNSGWYGVDVIVDDGTEGATYTSTVSIVDQAVAVRSGGASSISATGVARDPLNVDGTDTKTFTISGDSRRTVRRSMWEDRTSLSSLQFNENTLGPDFVSGGTSNEFGVEFFVQRSVSLVGVNIYKAPALAGSVIVTLWTGSGEVIAQKTVSWMADAGGWREVIFDAPATLAPDTAYVASYFNPNGNWAQNPWVYNGMSYYEWPFKVPAFLENPDGKINGSKYANAVESEHTFPTIYTATNYYIDPIAQWVEDTPGPGPDYFDQFPNGGSSFGVPVAVFFPDPEYIEDYFSIGVNTMCGVPITRAGYRDVIVSTGCDVYGAADGMTLVPEYVQQDPTLAARIKGYFLHDEPDMVHNPGSPADLWQSLQDIRRIDSTRPIVLNLGKWAPQSISYQWWPVGATVETLSQNWRLYGEIPDVISCDWYTIDGNPRTGIWCYQKMVQKMRQITDGRLPVWVYVETCPVEESDPTPEQVQRATWAGLIAGATGVVFFDHRFDEVWHGQGQDFASSLHIPAMRSAIESLAAQIQAVAGAINAEPLDLVTNVSSSNTTAGPLGGTYGVPIHQTSRNYGAYNYVFAQAIRPGTTTGTFTVPAAAGKTITVLNEGRTLTANGSGVFTDTFDGDYEYHLYRFAE